MTDFFALLEVPRRPWLEPDGLKEIYHRLTARQHPDVGGGSAKFAEINRAYQTLVDPAARLRHLLDLENPDALTRGQTVPPEVADLFAPVAEARQAVEAFLKKHGAAGSGLGKALLAGEQFEVQERVEQMIARLNETQETVLEKLRTADALWEQNRPAALQTLAAIWQALGFIGKWLTLLRESMLKLATL